MKCILALWFAAALPFSCSSNRTGNAPSLGVCPWSIAARFGWFQASSSAVCCRSAPLTSQPFALQWLRCWCSCVCSEIVARAADASQDFPRYCAVFACNQLYVINFIFLPQSRRDSPRPASHVRAPPPRPLLCVRADARVQLRWSPCFLHPAGADVSGPRAFTVRPQNTLQCLFSINQLEATRCGIPFLATARASTSSLVSCSCRPPSGYVLTSTCCCPINTCCVCLLMRRVRSGCLRRCAKKCALRTTAAA